MTDTPAKTMQLAPADWRQLCLLNIEQSHAFVTAIDPVNENGGAAITDQHMALIEEHFARQRAFLRGWKLSRIPQMAAPQPTQVQQQGNGKHVEAVAKPRRGGWPKGKSRKPKQQAVQQ